MDITRRAVLVAVVAGTDETTGQAPASEFAGASDVSGDNPYIDEPDTEFRAVAELSASEASA